MYYRLLFYGFLLFILPNVLFAKLDTAVLRICFEKDNKPFMISTKDADIAEKEQFVPNKTGDSFVRKFSLKMDGTPFFTYRPYNDNCVSVIKVTPGVHRFSIDFKSVEYTSFESENTISHNFKADLLYDGTFKIIQGATATVEISQSRNKVSLYQSLDNKPVEGCEEKCDIPTDIPVYFVTKADDSEVSCPVEYTLILKKSEKNNLECYNDKTVRSVLQKVVAENKVICKSNSEYAHFNVYGEGCVITVEADPTGLRIKEPEIFMLPLEKQSIRYFFQVGNEEEQAYIFSAEHKGKQIIPVKGSVIKFKEIIN